MSTEETPIDTPAADAVAPVVVVEESTKAEEPKEEKEEESTATFEPIVSHVETEEAEKGRLKIEEGLLYYYSELLLHYWSIVS
jgi:glucan-binding YG repeat protein